MVIEQSKLNGRNCGQVKGKINMAQFKLGKSHILMGSWNHVSWDAICLHTHLYKNLYGTLH